MLFRSLLIASALCSCVWLLAPRASQAAVPSGFQDSLVATVSQPSVLAFAPDGRLFIGEKASGRIRIYENGALLTQPFLDLDDFAPAGTYFETFNERGLLGIAFDPSFAANGFVYVYHSLCKTPGNPPQPGSNTCVTARNRVVRVRANGDVVDPTSHVVLLDDIENDAGNHNAGWIGFGPLDDRLYVAIGDGGSYTQQAQALNTLRGKILRIGSDGAIPADNPFVGTLGARGEIWATGVRNPYRCRFASDGRLFCGDVGNQYWEELNVVTRGANLGWPNTEGPFDAATHPQLTAPIHAYYHTNNMSAAIIAGDFGSKTSFPGDYQQSFFFADFALGRIQRARLATSGVAVQSIEDFATSLGTNSVTDVVAGPDGALYYASYGAGFVRRISVATSNRSPIAAASADVTTGPAPLTVQFSSAGSSDPDGDGLTYGWSFGDGSATSALAHPSHQYTAAGTYTATLTVNDGKASPGPTTATVTITVGGAPLVTIGSPVDGATFRAGDTITLAGTATDPEEGVLPTARLHWKVIFHHADHIHPYIDDLPGGSASFQTATSGEPDADVGYEVVLSATDATGLTGTASVVIVPVTSALTLQTDPPGLEVLLDGQPRSAPHTVPGVVGLQRSIGVTPMQTLGGQSWFFTAWSNGGAADHEIATPELDTTFTARFMPPATCAAPVIIPATGGSITSTTGGASAQAGTCAATGVAGEQVFQWTPVVSGTATIGTCGGTTSFDTVVYVRSGTCGAGAEIACADDASECDTSAGPHRASRVSVAVNAGQTYFLFVDGYGAGQGTFTLTVTPPSGPVPTATRTATPAPSATWTATPVPTPSRTVTPSPAAPTATRTTTPLATATPQPTASLTPSPAASPGACNAIVVPAAGGTFDGVTSGASAFNGTCSVSTNSPERVYQWTPAVSGAAVIATCGGTTSYDTALYVRNGSCTGPQVSCNDDTAGCGTSEPSSHHASRVTTNVTAGQTYFVFIDGYNGASGAYTLTITPPTGGPTASRTTSPTPATTTSATTTPVPTTTATATATPTTIPSATTTGTATAIATVTVTRTVTPAASATSTPTATAVATTTSTRTATPVATATPTQVATATSTRTATPVATATATPVPTTTRTATPVSTLTPIPTSTATAAPPTTTIAPSRTPTPSATTIPSGCGDVTVLPPGGGTFDGVVGGAGTQAGSCGATDKGGERLFAWTPDVSGPATIGTCGTGTLFDTVLYLRGGSCEGSEIRCVDDVTGCATGEPSNYHGSRIAPVVTAGQTYFIVVEGYNGAGGAFVLTIDPPTAGASPTPTRTASATPTIAATATATRTPTPGATSTPAPTATEVPTATATPVPSTTATRTATPATPATPAASATPIATATPVGGDACTAPIVLPPEGGSFPGVTSGLSSQNGACAVTNKAPERVFQWTPTASGLATFSTCGTETRFDTVLYLRGDACGGTELGCNDDTNGCGTTTSGYHGSRLTRAVSAGTTYFIVVDGYDSGAGPFVLTVVPPSTASPTPAATATVQPIPTSTLVPATATPLPTVTATTVVATSTAATTPAPAPTVTASPAPGQCGAIVVPPAGGTITGVTSGSSAHSGSCGTTHKAPETILQWTPSASGQATIATCGDATRFDTILHLRAATCDGTEIGCNDDVTGCGTGEPSTYHGSRLTPVVTAGETYFIFVDGYDTSAGAFSVTITQP